MTIAQFLPAPAPGAVAARFQVARQGATRDKLSAAIRTRGPLLATQVAEQMSLRRGEPLVCLTLSSSGFFQGVRDGLQSQRVN